MKNEKLYTIGNGYLYRFFVLSRGRCGKSQGEKNLEGLRKGMKEGPYKTGKMPLKMQITGVYNKSI